MADYTSWATFGGDATLPRLLCCFLGHQLGIVEKTVSDMHINISLESQYCQAELLRGASMLPVLDLPLRGSGATAVRVSNKSVASLLNYQPLIFHI